MKKPTSCAILGIMAVLAAVAGASLLQTGPAQKTKVLSESELKKAMSTEAASQGIVWKELCHLAPWRIFDGSNKLIIRYPIVVNGNVECLLSGGADNPTQNPQGSVTIFFRAPVAGKTVSVAFMAGPSGVNEYTRQFEWGYREDYMGTPPTRWTGKTAKVPGPIIVSYKPKTAGWNAVTVRMKTHSIWDFALVRAFQAQ